MLQLCSPLCSQHLCPQGMGYDFTPNQSWRRACGTKTIHMSTAPHVAGHTCFCSASFCALYDRCLVVLLLVACRVLNPRLRSERVSGHALGGQCSFLAWRLPCRTWWKERLRHGRRTSWPSNFGPSKRKRRRRGMSRTRTPTTPGTTTSPKCAPSRRRS